MTYRVGVLASLIALAACGSGRAASSPAASDMTTEPDSAAGESADGAASGQVRSHDGASGAGSGTAAAGKSGVDAFCAELCAHEQSCASIDAGSASLDACEATFQAFYETAGANPWGGNPPLELYRVDYVSALGSCIAGASCGEALSTSEARCSADLVAGVDGGAPAIAPTDALTSLCHAFEASSCLAADSGAGDCATALALFSDPSLTAGAACLSSPSSSCAAADSCFADAFTQQ